MTKNKKKLISILLTGSVFSTTISNNIFVSATESQNTLNNNEDNEALKFFEDYDEKYEQQRIDWFFKHKDLVKLLEKCVKEVFKTDVINIKKNDIKPSFVYDVRTKFTNKVCKIHKKYASYVKFFEDIERGAMFFKCCIEKIISEKNNENHNNNCPIEDYSLNNIFNFDIGQNRETRGEIFKALGLTLTFTVILLSGLNYFTKLS